MTKSIATGLLTLAVLSSLAAAQEKPAAGGAQATAPSWKAEPGKGITVSNGDSFGLTISGQLQSNYTFTANDGAAQDISSFNVPRARVNFKGNAFGKDLLYFLQLDAVDAGAAGDGAIKEGYVTWNFVNQDDTKTGLRTGQGKANYGFEGTGTSSGTFFSETSAATKAFANGYSRGAWIIGSTMENKLRWTAGAMNTDSAAGLGAGYVDRGEETANSDNELSYNASVNFDPLGKLFDGNNEAFRQGDFRTDDKSLKGTVGVGVALGNGRDGAGANDIESTSLNLNTAWNVEGFQFIGEYFMRTDDLQGPAADKEESDGFFVSATYVLPKNGDSTIQWGFGLRYSSISTDEGTAGGGVAFLTGGRGIGSNLGDSKEITAVIDAFYHGHAAKTQFEYTVQDVEITGGADTTNHIVAIAFQLLF